MFCPDYGNLAPLLFLHVVGHAGKQNRGGGETMKENTLHP